ncbi:sialidase family protein [Bacillus tianshenii]|nr:sialidase family protein [Bacillus tianshenii]
MKKKTIIPRKPFTYSSFPTITMHNDDVFLYYRQGRTSRSFVHGYEGSVKRWKINKNRLIENFENDRLIVHDRGYETTTFENRNENELDAIVSKLDDNLYSLVTRCYLPRKLNQPYVSISTTPEFDKRTPVKVPEVQWCVLYGKAFSSEHGYVFPAYGSLRNEPGERAFLLVTEDGKHWSVLSALPLNPKEYILNESSVTCDGEQYTIYMRSNKFPFAIWKSHSDDLIEWTLPERAIEKAQAPMAITYQHNTYVTYRDFSISHRWATSLKVNDNSPIRLEEYVGNPYDGGYSDLIMLNDKQLFVTYYNGNQAAEPFIRGALLHIDER